MSKHIENVYLNEIIKQANRAIHCANQLDQLLLQQSSEDFFREVEHFIQHAAAISQLLWPSDKKREKSAQHLRAKLNINEDNIICNRALRNHLVHYDERLDSWARKSKRHNYIDQCIGDIHNFVQGIDKTDFLRNFNPKSMEYMFLSERFNLKKIQASVEQIKQAIQKLR